MNIGIIIYIFYLLINRCISGTYILFLNKKEHIQKTYINLYVEKNDIYCSINKCVLFNSDGFTCC
jgi:hypothetical protein